MLGAWPRYAASALPRGMNPQGSMAGKCGEAAGLVLRAGGLRLWLTALRAGNSTASLAKTPQGGCQAVHIHARRGQAAGKGWHHKLQVALP